MIGCDDKEDTAEFAKLAEKEKRHFFVCAFFASIAV
jgi:hypothetical protein